MILIRNFAPNLGKKAAILSNILSITSLWLQKTSELMNHQDEVFDSFFTNPRTSL